MFISQPILILILSFILNFLVSLLNELIRKNNPDYDTMGKLKLIWCLFLVIKCSLSLSLSSYFTYLNWSHHSEFEDFMGFEIGYELESNMIGNFSQMFSVVITVLSVEDKSESLFYFIFLIISLVIMLLTGLLCIPIIILRVMIMTFLSITTMWPFPYLIIACLLPLLILIHLRASSNEHHGMDEEDVDEILYMAYKLLSFWSCLIFFCSLPGLRLYGWFLDEGSYSESLLFTSDLRPSIKTWVLEEAWSISNMI